MVHRTFFRRKKETCPFVPSPSSTSGPIIKMYLRQHIIPGEPTAKWTWQFKEFALKEISLQHARLSSARVSLGEPRRRNKYWRVLLPRYRKKLSCPFSASSSSFVAESSGFFFAESTFFFSGYRHVLTSVSEFPSMGWMAKDENEKSSLLWGSRANNLEGHWFENIVPQWLC